MILIAEKVDLGFQIENMGMQDKRLQLCVESICRKGCQSVRKDMEILQAEGELQETQGLSGDEKQQVLEELRTIMAVYGDSCRFPGE